MAVVEITDGDSCRPKKLIMTSIYLPYGSVDPLPPVGLADLVSYCSRANTQLILGCYAIALHTVWGSTDTNNRAKESWLVYGMMEYFIQTNSSRIVDILVKVQPPHDKFIFDRLAEWLHGPNKNQAITLFGHIVKKHPSWLYKVANHQLFKEILKLLKTEHNIISIMSALFCIIILLPIIPTSMPYYLQDLFDVFLYLASWNCNNVPRLTEDQIIHLQIGLSTFFQRLYGMFPCNFMFYLQENVIKEKRSVFVHTIKPLLETVKMHPMLLTANRESEKNNARWKEMEPHDVVVECSKFSLDYWGRVSDNFDCPQNRNFDWTCHGNADIPVSVQLQNTLKNAQYITDLSSPFYSLFNEPKQKMNENQRIDHIWSPSIAVLATPPPTGTIPHTPTPTTSMPSYTIQTIAGSQVCASGASPPEAAVEATPETTPMKDNIKTHRPFPVNSTAVRAIWGFNSQPSSPMKKEQTPFRFPDNPTTQYTNIEQTSKISSPKMQTLINDRNMYQMQLINDKLQQHQLQITGEQNAKIEVQLVPESSATKPKNEVNIDSFSNINVDSTQEDEEVTEINSPKTKTQKSDSSYECADCESEGSPCSTGGLHIPNSRSMHNYAQRFQEWRIRNQSESNTSCVSDGTSPTSKSPKSDIHKSPHQQNGDSSPSDDDKKKEIHLKSKLLRSKRKNFCARSDKINAETQTIEQVPQTYEQIFLELFSDANNTKSAQNIAPPPMSPHTLLDQYIETAIKKKASTDSNNRMEMYRDQIQLLHLQLQYERYRREVHAERNRRLLGKSRANAALEMDNDKLKEQKDKLTVEVEKLTASLNRACLAKKCEDQKNLEDKLEMTKTLQGKSEENKLLLLKIETLQRQLNDDNKNKKKLSLELEIARAEIFDLRNELQQTQYHADLGLQYKDELNRLQSEVILMGEIQMKCRDKINELNNLKARDAENEGLHYSYEQDIKELRIILDIKSAQLDTAKARLNELEPQVSRRDSMFTELKRNLKTVKEEYQDKFKALEAKYAAQKAIILRLEEEILELHKNHMAVNLATRSPDSDKTDLVGSLDHTSPLSISLASSDGLSVSLRSVTEIKNLHPLIVPPDMVANNPKTTSASSSISGASRQMVSEDIPVPIPGTSQHKHHQ